MDNEGLWDTIAILSEIRSNYDFFDDEEYKYYHALSEAIRALKDIMVLEEELE